MNGVEPGRLLLDTCAALWISTDAKLSAEARQSLNRFWRGGGTVLLSPFTAWEVGMLVARGRLSLTTKPLTWFQSLAEASGTALADLTPSILIESCNLPGDPPSDPADRIIISTAREYGCAVMTRDRQILAYAEKGHVSAIAC